MTQNGEKREGNTEKYSSYTQAATCVANRTQRFQIQQCVLKRRDLSASLNDNFDCEVRMFYGRLFQLAGPAYEKDL